MTKTSLSLASLLLLTSAAPALAQAPVPAPAPAPAPATPPAAAPAAPATAPVDPAAAPVDPAAAPPADPALAPAPPPEPAPAPAPAPAPPPPLPTVEEPDEDKEPPCAITEKLCIGPVLTLGLINPFGIGVHARYDRMWGFGLDYQFLSLPEIGGVTAGMSLFTLNGRWYPGGSNFFLMAGFGFQSFSLEAKGTGATAEGSISAPLFAFGLGVQGGQGFVMGIDLALEIPLGSLDVEFESSPPTGATPMEAMAYAALQADINSFGEDVVKLIPLLFQLNLLRIGYMF